MASVAGTITVELGLALVAVVVTAPNLRMVGFGARSLRDMDIGHGRRCHIRMDQVITEVQWTAGARWALLQMVPLRALYSQFTICSQLILEHSCEAHTRGVVTSLPGMPG